MSNSIVIYVDSQILSICSVCDNYKHGDQTYGPFACFSCQRDFVTTLQLLYQNQRLPPCLQGRVPEHLQWLRPLCNVSDCRTCHLGKCLEVKMNQSLVPMEDGQPFTIHICSSLECLHLQSSNIKSTSVKLIQSKDGGWKVFSPVQSFPDGRVTLTKVYDNKTKNTMPAKDLSDIMVRPGRPRKHPKVDKPKVSQSRKSLLKAKKNLKMEKIPQVKANCDQLDAIKIKDEPVLAKKPANEATESKDFLDELISCFESEYEDSILPMNAEVNSSILDDMATPDFLSAVDTEPLFLLEDI